MSMRIALLVSGLAAWPGAVSPVAAQPAAIEVREDTAFGGHPGTLRVGDDGVTFEARDPKRSRRWTFGEVRQLRIESSRRIVVETYQSRGWSRLGHSRTFEYRTTTPVTPEWVGEVLSRITRPVVTSVIPPRAAPAQFTADVHHEGTDTAGRLALYAEGLVFETTRDGFARFWRLTDLDAVLLQDRYRLLVTVYEGSREHVRPFLFTLKHELPPGFYEQLWRAVNGRAGTVPKEMSP
ncbi:MAG: hypothetical protein Q8O42_06545 [Acidobacteriota bacterium]|nr:hypothetical protein [Acidobacteriota bacterium]